MGGKLSSSGTETSALGFQSDLTDPDSALVDMGTRWYVPSLGRFSTRDVVFGEVQNPASLNMFAYGLSAPVTYVDPTGMRVLAANDDSDYCYECNEPEAVQSSTGFFAYSACMTAKLMDIFMDSAAERYGAKRVKAAMAGAGIAGKLGGWMYRSANAKEPAACHGIGGCLAHALEWTGDRAGSLALDATSYLLARPGLFLGHPDIGTGTSRPCSNGSVHATCHDYSLFAAEVRVLFDTDAITLGDEIMCAEVCTEEITRHELVHVGQENRDGLFWERYLWQAATRGYCQIEYEKEAYEVAGTCGEGSSLLAIRRPGSPADVVRAFRGCGSLESLWGGRHGGVLGGDRGARSIGGGGPTSPRGHAAIRDPVDGCAPGSRRVPWWHRIRQLGRRFVATDRDSTRWSE